MSITLSIYSKSAYKEFVLPHQHNTETVISLRKEIFGLTQDLDLPLENNDGQWRFRSCAAFKVARGSAPYGGEYFRDGDYLRCETRDKRVLAIMVRESTQRFTAYGKYMLVGSQAVIGTEPGCALRYSFSCEGRQYISMPHAIIHDSGKHLSLEDRSLNGVFVNDIRISGNVQLNFGDRIDIWGLSIVVLGKVLAIRSVPDLVIDFRQIRLAEVAGQPLYSERADKVRYHRAPRNMERLITEVVNIEAPPPPQRLAEAPLFMTIGPALTMALPMLMGSGLAILGAGGGGGVYMYTGLITAMMSAIIGATWAMVNVRHTRKQAKNLETQRFVAYSDYLVRIAEDIQRKYKQNSQILHQTYPSAQQCVQDGCRHNHLWERNVRHPDFLSYRLGLGDVPFQVDIRIPGERFEMVEDSLRTKPAMIREEYQMLHEVPVCVDLSKERVIGLVGGPDRSGARATLYNLVSQIAVQNCYTDVKLAFIYHADQGDDASKWDFCRWLPHVWSEGRKFRFVAANKTEASDVFYELANVMRIRGEQQLGREPIHKPWYIVVIEDSAVLENEPVAKYLLNAEQNLGITTILLADQAEDLPNSCECIIRAGKEIVEMYHASALEEKQSHIRPDHVSSRDLEALARSLSKVEVNEIEVGGEIPNAVTFFDMHGVDGPRELMVEERWKKSRTYENMRALIGWKSGNQPCYLDVHEKYHGPHGLVAGTTGSGKSETLQTYILSLAMSFSPHDVGLFIIDYKGGGMANLFDGLPHMLGQISNLSGGQVRRAMVSIKSENMRRQRIFNENGVNNINLYTSLYKNGEATEPVPHLFIVIDEFAELKREQPDFMRELISVAQVGRSLGVHLILATQKPSGTVDDNIWSNSKFRLCLRVQDRQDSMDMLHKADAAYLTQAGRGFLQVGNDEVYEQFQSGWSGATYDEATAGSKQVLAKMLTNTGKTAIVGSYVKRQMKEKQHLQWMELLVSCADAVREQNQGTVGKVSEQQFSAGMYEALHKWGVDYAESEFNTRALNNLLRVLLAAEAKSVPGDKRAAWIIENTKGKLPERKEKTQLDAMVEYLASVARDQGYKPLAPLWLPPLPEILTLDEVEGWKESTFRMGAWPSHGKKWELSAIIGRGDDPANQTQLPIEINFTRGGHHALIGSASTGKSTFVQSLIYSLIHRYTPEHLNIYALDFSGRMSAPFEKSAHVGGILYENDVERVGKMFYLLQEMVDERKRLFRGGNYSQYVMVNGVTCPAVVVFIDNIANFREKTGEAYDKQLVRLVNEGVSCGIYFFITAAGFGINELHSRLGDHIKTTLSLELQDVYQYSDALRTPHPGLVPEAGVRGRGLINLDGTVLEYQTALALQAGDDYERIEKIEAECAALNNAWKGARARQVPFIPQKPVWADLEQRSEMAQLLADPARLPIAYDYTTAGVYSLDLSRIFCWMVAGRERTGKTNVLKLVMRSATAKGARVIVLENSGASLKKEAETLGARYCATLEEIVSFVGELGPTFRERHIVKDEMAAQGVEEDAQFERMSTYQPWFVVISDMGAFMELVYSEGARQQNLHRALENLITKGFMHNIFFVAAMNQDDRSKLVGRVAYEAFIKGGNGMHLGGNVASQQLFDFSTMSFKEQTVVEKSGVGLVPGKQGEAHRRVILPLVKG